MEKIIENINKGIADGIKAIGKKREYVTCPFCGIEDFDLPGLKYHLTNYKAKIYCKKMKVREKKDKENKCVKCGKRYSNAFTVCDECWELELKITGYKEAR